MLKLKDLEGSEANFPKKEDLDEARLSACMIVRDEWDRLGRCLESIKDLCDEIIIVDTGSKDRTLDTARHYTDKVYEIEWPDSFSKARNESLKHATGDFILIIDADEWLSDTAAISIRTNINHFRKDPSRQIFDLQVVNYFSNGQASTLWSPRVFRAHPDFKYEYAVHNQVRHPGRGTPHTRLDGILMHDGYMLPPEKMEKKHIRTMTLLEKQVKEEPGICFHWANLATSYFGLKRYGDCLDAILIANQIILEELEKSGGRYVSNVAASLPIYFLWHHLYLSEPSTHQDSPSKMLKAVNILRASEDYTCCIDLHFIAGAIYARLDARRPAERAFSAVRKLVPLYLENKLPWPHSLSSLSTMYLMHTHMAQMYERLGDRRMMDIHRLGDFESRLMKVKVLSGGEFKLSYREEIQLIHLRRLRALSGGRSMDFVNGITADLEKSPFGDQ